MTLDQHLSSEDVTVATEMLEEMLYTARDFGAVGPYVVGKVLATMVATYLKILEAQDGNEIILEYLKQQALEIKIYTGIDINYEAIL